MRTPTHDTGRAPVAVVTGGAHGIGRAVVDALVTEGWSVGVLDADPSVTDAFADSPAVLPIACDVSDEAAMREAIAAVASRFDGLDAVVANAGVGGPDTSMLDTAAAAMQRVMDINYGGSLHAARFGAEQMLRTGGRGRIVFLASLFAQQPVAGAAAYISSKGAVSGLTHALAVELAPAITVNAVAPGYIMTEMHREELRSRAERAGTDFAEQERLVRDLVPLARHGSPADIADGVAFLLSERAGYITGQTLNINGGVQVS